jgi:hypothetical protein
MPDKFEDNIESINDLHELTDGVYHCKILKRTVAPLSPEDGIVIALPDDRMAVFTPAG